MNDDKRIEDANAQQVGGDHYKSAEYQHWDFVADTRMGYFPGNISKYVTRWRKKNGIEDLQKASHYMHKLLQLITSGAAVQASCPLDMLETSSLLYRYSRANRLWRAEEDIVRVCATWSHPDDWRFACARLADLLAAARQMNDNSRGHARDPESAAISSL